MRLYPGLVLLEGTNPSEGRGTTLPLQLLGAPWIEGYVVDARALRPLEAVVRVLAHVRTTHDAFAWHDTVGGWRADADRWADAPQRADGVPGPAPAPTPADDRGR
ncbi:MAG TPA: hypothetical protein VLA35_06555 [Thermoleophilia bacterium]|nr:hypothetical protein [Thermoleophilia bacterium]